MGERHNIFKLEYKNFFNRSFSSIYTINLDIYNPNGSPASGVYQDSGGITYFDNDGFYGGFSRVGYTFFWIAVGIS
jgi:hypothetical protein